MHMLMCFFSGGVNVWVFMHVWVFVCGCSCEGVCVWVFMCGCICVCMCMCYKFACNLCVVVVWVDLLNHDHAANHTSVPPEGLAAKMRKTFLDLNVPTQA